MKIFHATFLSRESGGKGKPPALVTNVGARSGNCAETAPGGRPEATAIVTGGEMDRPTKSPAGRAVAGGAGAFRQAGVGHGVEVSDVNG